MGKHKHHHKEKKVGYSSIKKTLYTNKVPLMLVVAIIIFGFWLFAPGEDMQEVVRVTPQTLLEKVEEPQKQEDLKEVVKEDEKKEFEYIEIIDSCGAYFEGGACVNLRSGPGTSYEVVQKLRTGVVLRTSGSIEAEGYVWYKVMFDEWLRYPERVEGDLYVAGDFVRVFVDSGTVELTKDTPATNKKVVIDLSDQMLYAYEGENFFMEESVSTGLELTLTPKGSFRIFKKMPSRYMQGPIPEVSDQYYDLPGVPWTLYFTAQGAAIHGAYWHNNFGQVWSHGCVNLPPEKAMELYIWADPGTLVQVQD